MYQAPAPQPVVSIYVEPPLFQPPPIRVLWAPPPMLVEIPQPMPFAGAIWTGGYWVWEGNWVWAHGRWASPPQPGYGWINPYYENRGGSVVFVNGFWAAPGVSFVAPSMSVNIAFGVVAAGVIAGPRPIGPQGVFVPPPPGSHVGLIVPAPIGTAPAVVTGAPPIIREGMHINANSNNATTINNNVSNVRNVTNITNVTIVAPPGATANGQAVNSSVPAQAHLAAAIPPVVKAYAPEPASTKPIPAYVPGRPPVALPPAQVVRSEVTPALAHPRAGAASPPTTQFNSPPPAAAAMHSAPMPMPTPMPMPNQANNQQKPMPVPNQANIQQKQNAMQPGSYAPQDKRDYANQGAPGSKPIEISQAKPAQKTVAPGNANQQKPNGEQPKKQDAKKPKKDDKLADKHERE